MGDFIYTARNKDGHIVSDTLSAPTREAVGGWLRSRGLLPTSIIERRRKFFSFKDLLSKTLGHVSLLEKLTFVKNLAVTLKAGLPITKALQVLQKQMPNPHFQNILSQMTHGVESGKTLSESLGQYPQIFPRLMVNMVKVGEQSGELDQILEYLAAQIARDYNLIRRTKGALIYPAVVVAALIIIGYIMFSFVLPKLTATFTEFQADLPFLTTMIIRIVDIFSKYSYLIALALIVFIVLFLFWRRTVSGRAFIHKFILMLPVGGKLVKKINLARFTIIFSSLLRSGMPIVDALKATGESMGNIYYRNAVLDASEKVEVGVDLVLVLEKYPKLFTPMVTQMIQVGEESGTMEKVLAEVSNFYEAEIDDTVKNLSSVIEPILVIIIGAVVGVLAVGLILPIYSIGENI